MSGTTIHCQFQAPRQANTVPDAPRTSRAARMLALAHHVERLVDEGELASYTEAARALGLTRARLTQVTNLLLLAPEIQERVLTGDLPGTERRLRGAVREAEWDVQLSVCARSRTELGE